MTATHDTIETSTRSGWYDAVVACRQSLNGQTRPVVERWQTTRLGRTGLRRRTSTDHRCVLKTAPLGSCHNSEVWRARIRTWDTLPAPNFIRIVQGDLSLMDKFYQKIWNFHDFQLLKSIFLYHNVKILLKRTDFLIGIHQRHKILSKSLEGPAGIALPRGGDAVTTMREGMWWYLLLWISMFKTPKFPKDIYILCETSKWHRKK